MGQGNVPFTFDEYEAKHATHTHTHRDMILWLNVIQKFYAKPGKIIVNSQNKTKNRLA